MRQLRIVVAFVVLFSVVVATGATAQTETRGTESESAVEWRTCGARAPVPGFECAQVSVPLDHDAPNRSQISIQLARLPAGDPETKIGSIFLNPGGPGGSGRNFLFNAGPFLFTDEVRERFDLIGFDPRGIALSSPLTCFDSLEESFAGLPPFAFPMTPAEQAIEKATTEFLAASCDADAGPIMDHMSTADVARDMDLIREMLGEESLNYAGYSYGSFIGAVYANLFPDHVRALVVDGIVDPVEWSTGVGDAAETYPVFTRIGSHLGAQDTLDEFFRLCDDAGPTSCALAPDSSGRFDALATQLLAAPIEVVDPETGEVVSLRYSDVMAITGNALYQSAGWPFLAGFLYFVEAGASPQVLGQSLAAVIEATGFSPLQRPPYDNVVEGQIGVVCSDTDNPDAYEAWPAAAAVAAQESYFGEFWTHIGEQCWNWPGLAGDRYVGPFTQTTANTVLIANPRYDPATRYEAALALRSMLPNSALLTVEGWGHTTLFLSACADAAVATYFLTGTAPVDGTVCSQDFTPFLTDSAPADDATAAAVARAERRSAVMDEIAIRPGR